MKGKTRFSIVLIALLFVLAGCGKEEIPMEEPVELSQPQSAFAWWMVPVALGVFVIGGGCVAAIIAAGAKNGRYERRWKERMEK